MKTVDSKKSKVRVFQLWTYDVWGNARDGFDVNDGDGALWIYRDASGLTAIVRARGESAAYEIVQDEFLPRVAPENVHSAYGFDSAEAFAAAREEKPADSFDLIDGYAYQSNATGTGIVEHDINGELLEPLTAELLERLEIVPVFKLAEIDG